MEQARQALKKLNVFAECGGSGQEMPCFQKRA
jgi:hypothetical protein